MLGGGGPSSNSEPLLRSLGHHPYCHAELSVMRLNPIIGHSVLVNGEPAGQPNHFPP